MSEDILGRWLHGKAVSMYGPREKGGEYWHGWMRKCGRGYARLKRIL